ncbi:MAG TPA: 50S ribosomal protein L32 [Dehalococcoidia bacterium]|nr:50S ribosomal protein L32 [Dehalococcoidia bacterium]
MPPLPKRKYPKARQGKRRSHLALKPAGLTRCPQCRSPRMPHTACPSCGFYKRAGAVAIKAERSTELP